MLDHVFRKYVIERIIIEGEWFYCVKVDDVLRETIYIAVKPTKYMMLTYWASKKAHEEFHKQPTIVKGFTELLKYLSIMPYEEYGEIMR